MGAIHRPVLIRWCMMQIMLTGDACVMQERDHADRALRPLENALSATDQDDDVFEEVRHLCPFPSPSASPSAIPSCIPIPMLSLSIPMPCLCPFHAYPPSHYYGSDICVLSRCSSLFLCTKLVVSYNSTNHMCLKSLTRIGICESRHARC